MGMLSNSVNFVRYEVEGKLPENFWDFAAERIAAFSFRDIDDSYEERSVGWVSILNMFDSEFQYASYAAGDNVVLSLRVDERKVAAAALKKYCLKEEERIKRERQIPRLSKSQKIQIKEDVHLMLLKRAVPVPAVYDLYWDLSAGTVIFFAVNQKARTVLEEFFEKTFGLGLILQIPYNTALHLLSEEEQENLAGIKPGIFV